MDLKSSNEFRPKLKITMALASSKELLFFSFLSLKKHVGMFWQWPKSTSNQNELEVLRWPKFFIMKFARRFQQCQTCSHANLPRSSWWWPKSLLDKLDVCWGHSLASLLGRFWQWSRSFPIKASGEVLGKAKVPLQQARKEGPRALMRLPLQFMMGEVSTMAKVLPQRPHKERPQQSLKPPLAWTTREVSVTTKVLPWWAQGVVSVFVENVLKQAYRGGFNDGQYLFWHEL